MMDAKQTNSWNVLFVTTLLVVLGTLGRTPITGTFQNYVASCLELSDTKISLAYSVATLIGGILVSFVGLGFCKKWKLIVVLSVLGFGLVPLELFLLCKYSALLKSFAFILIFFCFLQLRFFAQGALPLLSRTIASWKFKTKNLGIVGAFHNTFLSLALGIFPLICSVVSKKNLWETVWFWAWWVILLIAVLSWILFRKEEVLFDENIKKPSKLSFSLKKTFIAPILLLGVHSMINTGIAFHLIDISAEIEVSSTTAFSIYLPVTMLSVVLNFVFGILANHLRTSKLFLIFGISLVFMIFTLKYLKFWPGYLIFIFSSATGWSLRHTLVYTAWPRLIPKEGLWSINANIISVQTIGSAIGPILFVFIKYFFKTYYSAAFVFVIIALALSVITYNIINKLENGLSLEQRS